MPGRLGFELADGANNGTLPFAETAATIASGKGILGTNLEYPVQLATQLQALDIHAPYVAQLHASINAGGPV